MVLPTFWRKRFLVVEASIVALVTIVFAGWIFVLQGSEVIEVILQENRANLYRTTATIAGTLMAVTLTASTIALNALGQERLTIIRNSAHSRDIWRILFQTIWLLAALTVTSLACLVFETDERPSYWLVTLFVLFGGLVVVRIMRTIWVVEQIYKIASN